jgi:D-glycero-D-manno-heptose 1,7-bisphosphate phosphatase
MNAPAPAAFLDRDGVLNVDRGYVFRPEDLELVPGAAEGVRHLNEAGMLVVLVTNQSGIGRGYYTEANMMTFNRHLADCLSAQGARIDAIYFCPYHPDAAVERFRADHEDRKPRPGLINRACAEMNIDRQESFLIGDKESDMEAAAAAGIAGYRFEGGNFGDFVLKVLERSAR